MCPSVRRPIERISAKLIAWGPDREQARRRLVAALRETVLLGLTTNAGWLVSLLETPEFVSGDISTDALPEVGREDLPDAVWAAALVAAPARGSGRIAAEGRGPARPRCVFRW